ncbi:hypothetical protein BJ508DRAFT_318666 [Ascobolus immersus RN42]|uniref:Uncharacterized protein n=1 Tax=Ascobolus immersus RN42 TaxID=1160509 RepID=A0A3N4I1I9_ASCIM|nr:hypothetical protein BJ508DRAFT_318666 [Ascobolus immersus RN42]
MTNHRRTQQVLIGLWLLTLVTEVLALPNDETCPHADELVYSPFRPWFSFWPDSDRQACWHFSSCLFIEANESRKQQFAATALVMGLVPLTLKDIAWPERRLVPVSKKLPALIEILVLALGLVPVVAPPDSDIREAADTSPVLRWAWKLPKKLVLVVIAAATILLLTSYGGLAVVEIYSKRSSLGCPFPVFVLMWHVVGLLPATCHVVFHNMKQSWAKGRRERVASRLEKDGGVAKEGSSAVSVRGAPESSAVQGADEWWLVQLSWAIYYIAGTLIFTSIMGLTVIELVVWVLIEFAVTGASKLLALFLCLKPVILNYRAPDAPKPKLESLH